MYCSTGTDTSLRTDILVGKGVSIDPLSRFKVLCAVSPSSNPSEWGSTGKPSLIIRLAAFSLWNLSKGEGILRSLIFSNVKPWYAFLGVFYMLQLASSNVQVILISWAPQGLFTALRNGRWLIKQDFPHVVFGHAFALASPNCNVP